jgi:hypothetical protein
MKVTAKVVFRLAVFLAVAGLVYAVTGHEPAGRSMILVAAAAFAYIGLVLRAAVRQDDAEAAGSPAEDEHVGPTIWPFVFSVAAIGLVLGLVVARWLLVVGSAVFVASAIGWAVDVRRQHADHHQS